MTQTEQLIASLAATDSRSYMIDDDRYFDWTTETEEGVVMEVGNGREAVQVEMDRHEMLALQQRLTAWLLRDAK